MLGRVPLIGLLRGELPAQAFHYLILAQHRKAWFTERRPLPALEPGADGIATCPLEVGSITAYTYDKGMATKDGYPELPPDATPAGTVNRLLDLGPVVVVWLIGIPGAADQPALLLRSGSFTLEIEAPILADLAPADREAVVGGVLRGFRGSAYTAKRAHAMATGLGPALVPDLVPLAADASLAEHGRMWLCTALADLGGPEAAACVRGQFPTATPGLRNVLAYHGPKLRDEPLDTAIVAAAVDAPAEYVAWSLRGFAMHRNRVPSQLLDIALASDKAPLRATAIDVMVQCPEDVHRPLLVHLLGDPHPRVRGGAAIAVSRLAIDTPEARLGIAGALDEADDGARQRICDNLGKLAGTAHPYDPDAADEAKAEVIAYWKRWLAR